MVLLSLWGPEVLTKIVKQEMKHFSGSHKEKFIFFGLGVRFRVTIKSNQILFVTCAEYNRYNNNLTAKYLLTSP